MQRWLDYWINFDNRPFAPDTREISWNYIYDDPNKPKEVMVIVEAGGEYGGRLFAPPSGGGGLADYPPEVEGDNFQEGFGPLEITAGADGQWLSVMQGIPVRKDTNSKVVEKLNMTTGQWEVVKPEIILATCTSENFLQYEIPAESLLDGTYLEALRKENEPFDVTKIKTDVPLVNEKTSVTASGTDIWSITYSYQTAPNFPTEDSRSFRRVLRGFVSYESRDYAVISLELYDLQHPQDNVNIIALYGFNSRQNTDEMKKKIIEIMETKMSVVPLISANLRPDTGLPDPLIDAAGTFKLSDIQDRIKRFVNNNTYSNGVGVKQPKFTVKDAGGEEEHSTLDGLIFLTDIYNVIRGNNFWK